MFGSWVLDVAIGLIVVFILFSTICATLREGLEACLKTRAAFLERGIRELLNDRHGKGLSKQLYEHPLVYALFSGDYQQKDQKKSAPGVFDSGGNLPSYIPSQNFALALMDIVAHASLTPPQQNGANGTPQPDPAAPGQLTTATLRANVAAIQNDKVARGLVSVIDAAQGDLDQARRNIEQWFDSAMDRVSGWYRRKTNLVVFFIGLILAAALNIDTFAIANHLYRNQTSRDAIVQRADELVKPPGTSGSIENSTQQKPPLVSSSQRFNESLQLPIGWSNWDDANGMRIWLMMIAGWLVTALAATLGAPFWFDVLNKVIIVRSTVKSYEKSPEKGSKERLSPPAPNQQVDTGTGTNGAGANSNRTFPDSGSGLPIRQF